jgi:hypothetical protein
MICLPAPLGISLFFVVVKYYWTAEADNVQLFMLPYFQFAADRSVNKQPSDSPCVSRAE